MSKVFESREYLFKKWLELFNATCNNDKIILYRKNINNIPLFLPLSLEYLDLSNNEIIEIPKEIGQLFSLKGLKLHGNRIVKIPEEIEQLTSLRHLSLENNQINKISEQIKYKLNNCTFYI